MTQQEQDRQLVEMLETGTVYLNGKEYIGRPTAAERQAAAALSRLLDEQARLRKALALVEWQPRQITVETRTNTGALYKTETVWIDACPWCDGVMAQGHALDCARQQALSC